MASPLKKLLQLSSSVKLPILSVASVMKAIRVITQLSANNAAMLE